MFLGIKTDNPISELILFDGKSAIDSTSWEANKRLADTIHTKIDDLLNRNNKLIDDLGGLIVFIGPGSYTGLRIGVSVANTLAYALKIPVVGAKGKEWGSEGSSDLLQGKNDKIVIPFYGGEANIGISKK